MPLSFTNYSIPPKMKKTIICCLLIIVFLIPAEKISAQSEIGKFFVAAGSSLDFSSFSSKWKTDYGSGDNGKSRNLELKSQVGYFVLNNISFGLEVPYIYTKTINSYETITSSSFTLVPFLKCYFGKSKVKPYLQGGMGMGWESTSYKESTSPELKVPSKIIAREIGGGLGIFLNEHCSIDIGMGYSYASDKWLDKSTNMNWNETSQGIAASIGFQICL